MDKAVIETSYEELIDALNSSKSIKTGSEGVKYFSQYLIKSG